MENKVINADFGLMKDFKYRYLGQLIGLDEKKKSYYEDLIPEFVRIATVAFGNRNFQVPFEELSIDEQVAFYDEVFRLACEKLIGILTTGSPVSAEDKEKIMQYLADNREADKDSMQLEEEMDGYRPLISDYEFSLPRMMEDIQYYIDNLLGQRNNMGGR